MSSRSTRLRGEAFTGKRYGTMRRELQEKARDQIEQSICEGYYCEAVAIIESVVSDRLESRLAFLKNQPGLGFMTLYDLVRELRCLESDPEMASIIEDVDAWRVRRNRALHELVKVQADVPCKTWDHRKRQVAATATEGYEMLKRLYYRVAALNPLSHSERVFPRATA